jgi:hypothetical protein
VHPFVAVVTLESRLEAVLPVVLAAFISVQEQQLTDAVSVVVWKFLAAMVAAAEMCS